MTRGCFIEDPFSYLKQRPVNTKSLEEIESEVLSIWDQIPSIEHVSKELDHGKLVRFVGMVIHDSLEQYCQPWKIEHMDNNNTLSTLSLNLNDTYIDQDMNEYGYSSVHIKRVLEFREVLVFGVISIPGCSNWLQEKLSGVLGSALSVKCHMFVRNGHPCPPFKLHDIVEIAGILVCSFSGNRVLCLHSKRVDLFSYLPAFHSPQSSFDSLRVQIISYLSSFFHHDQLVGELVLLALIENIKDTSKEYPLSSRPFKYKSLNIILKNCTVLSSVMDAFVDAMRLLWPVVVSVDVTREALQGSSFVPDYCSSNSFELDMDQEISTHASVPIPGIFQASNGTLFILNETQMSEGALDEAGVSNYHSLTNLVHQHKLTISSGYELQLPVDYVFLVVTSNSSSILKLDSVVTVDYLNSSPDQNLNFVSSEWFNSVRSYLMHCRNLISTIPQTFSRDLEEEYLEKRKINATNPDQFHSKLSFTRLVASSYASETVDHLHLNRAAFLLNKLSLSHQAV